MNLQKMMKQAQEMQAKINEMQARVQEQEAEGQAGGGMVKIKLNGKNEMLSASLDPSLLKADEKEMLEDLIIAAYNDARGKIDAASSDAMAKITSGMQLPPGFKLPF